MSTYKPDLIIPEKWYGFDFNRTLAEYHRYEDDMLLARPLPMLEKLKEYLAMGRVCKIVTAQVWMPAQRRYLLKRTPAEQTWFEQAQGYYQRANLARAKIQGWCQLHLGRTLEITCERDPGCQELWDDKAWHVIPNVGKAPGPPFTFFEETGEYDTEKLRNSLEEFKRRGTIVITKKIDDQMTWSGTFSDEEIENMYFNMLQRNNGVPPSRQKLPKIIRQSIEESQKISDHYSANRFNIFDQQPTEPINREAGEPAQPDEAGTPASPPS